MNCKKTLDGDERTVAVAVLGFEGEWTAASLQQGANHLAIAGSSYSDWMSTGVIASISSPV